MLELPALGEHYAPGSRAALHQLERRLFEPGPAPERVDPGAAVRLLEAGGELAEAELVAAEVLELLRAGLRGEEIAVVYRSPERSGALVERVFGRYGIPVARERRTALGASALGRGLLALARCALLGPGRASAEDLLEYLRTPGRRESPDDIDRLEAEVRRQGLRTAGQAMSRAQARHGFELDEIDALRAAEAPGEELVRQGRRLLAAPHQGRAPVLDEAEELDARAVAALERALAELGRGRGSTPAGEELIELLERLELPGASLAAPTRCSLPIRCRSGPGAFAPCWYAAFRRASSRWPPRPSRSCPMSCAASWPRKPGCACARARTRWPASATCSTPASRAPPSG